MSVKSDKLKSEYTESDNDDKYLLKSYVHVYKSMSLEEFKNELISPIVFKTCLTYISKNYWAQNYDINVDIIKEAKAELFDIKFETKKEIDNEITLFLIEIRDMFKDTLPGIKRALRNGVSL